MFAHLCDPLIFSLKLFELLLFLGECDIENKQLLFALKRYIFFLYNIRSSASSYIIMSNLFFFFIYLLIYLALFEYMTQTSHIKNNYASRKINSKCFKSN